MMEIMVKVIDGKTDDILMTSTARNHVPMIPRKGEVVNLEIGTRHAMGVVNDVEYTYTSDTTNVRIYLRDVLGS